jgi:hypothetical protein
MASAGTSRATPLGQRRAQGPFVASAGRRREHRHPGHAPEQRQVEHAVVRGPVRSGDPGAVDAQHDGQVVEPDVQVDLVERPSQERRVDRHHRTQAPHGHAGGGGHRVLLGDPHVEEAVGEGLGERP